MQLAKYLRPGLMYSLIEVETTLGPEVYLERQRNLRTEDLKMVSILSVQNLTAQVTNK